MLKQPCKELTELIRVAVGRPLVTLEKRQIVDRKTIIYSLCNKGTIVCLGVFDKDT